MALNLDTGSLNDIDTSSLPDLHQAALKTGYDNLTEALYRRLITPRGGLFYDPDYGYDLRQHINQENISGLLNVIAWNVEQECEKDDRVLEAEARLVIYDLRNFKLDIACTTVEQTAPWQIALTVDATGVSLIRPPTETMRAPGFQRVQKAERGHVGVMPSRLPPRLRYPRSRYPARLRDANGGRP